MFINDGGLQRTVIQFEWLYFDVDRTYAVDIESEYNQSQGCNDGEVEQLKTSK